VTLRVPQRMPATVAALGWRPATTASDRAQGRGDGQRRRSHRERTLAQRSVMVSDRDRRLQGWRLRTGRGDRQQGRQATSCSALRTLGQHPRWWRPGEAGRSGAPSTAAPSSTSWTPAVPAAAAAAWRPGDGKRPLSRATAGPRRARCDAEARHRRPCDRRHGRSACAALQAIEQRVHPGRSCVGWKGHYAGGVMQRPSEMPSLRPPGRAARAYFSGKETWGAADNELRRMEGKLSTAAVD
jgi:hypothetical protein